MQDRRKFLTQTSLAAGALTLLKPMQVLAGSTSTLNTKNTLTILYTADLCEQWNQADGAGGINAVSDAVSKIKRENSNVLLVDAGNILSPGSKKSISHLHYFTALKKAGFDAITPGSNDMQHGADYFSRLTEESRLKAVAVNYNNEGVLQEAVLPYRIVRKGAAKVGIIGIGTNKAKGLNSLSSSKLVSLVNNTAAALKQIYNCNVVICISHLSLKNEEGLDNMRLAGASLGIDMIISDNDQRFTYNTHVVKNKTSHDVFVTHAGKKGTMLGRIDIGFNHQGEKINITAKQIFTGLGEQDARAAFRKQATSAMV